MHGTCRSFHLPSAPFCSPGRKCPGKSMRILESDKDLPFILLYLLFDPDRLPNISLHFCLWSGLIVTATLKYSASRSLTERLPHTGLLTESTFPQLLEPVLSLLGTPSHTGEPTAFTCTLMVRPQLCDGGFRGDIHMLIWDSLGNAEKQVRTDPESHTQNNNSLIVASFCAVLYHHRPSWL